MSMTLTLNKPQDDTACASEQESCTNLHMQVGHQHEIQKKMQSMTLTIKKLKSMTSTINKPQFLKNIPRREPKKGLIQKNTFMNGAYVLVKHIYNQLQEYFCILLKTLTINKPHDCRGPQHKISHVKDELMMTIMNSKTVQSSQVEELDERIGVFHAKDKAPMNRHNMILLATLILFTLQMMMYLCGTLMCITIIWTRTHLF